MRGSLLPDPPQYSSATVTSSATGKTDPPMPLPTDPLIFFVLLIASEYLTRCYGVRITNILYFRLNFGSLGALENAD